MSLLAASLVIVATSGSAGEGRITLAAAPTVGEPAEDEYAEDFEEPKEKDMEETKAEPRRRLGIGVLAGAFVPSAAQKEDYGTSYLLGFFWRGSLGETRVSYEAGLDFSPVESASGDVSSSLYMIRGSVLFGAGKRAAVWGLVGGRVLVESAEIYEAISRSEYMGGLDLGAGVSLRKLDARVVYSFLVGGGNVTGGLTATVGTTF